MTTEGNKKMANKFAENVQIEEDKAYQDWLDAQELKDIQALNGEPV